MKYPTTIKQAGFSYVEVLVATALIAICLVPMMESLTAGARFTGMHGTIAADTLALQTKIETLLAKNYADLDIAAGSSNSSTSPVAASGYTDANYNVHIYRCDKLNDQMVLNNAITSPLCVKVQQKNNGLSLMAIRTPK